MCVFDQVSAIAAIEDPAKEEAGEGGVDLKIMKKIRTPHWGTWILLPSTVGSKQQAA